MSFVIVADVTTRFDQVFWFGDFNFRLSKDRVDVETIMNRTVAGDMGPLLAHDQLSKEMKDGMLACRRSNLCGPTSRLLCLIDSHTLCVLLFPSRFNL